MRRTTYTCNRCKEPFDAEGYTVSVIFPWRGPTAGFDPDPPDFCSHDCLAAHFTEIVEERERRKAEGREKDERCRATLADASRCRALMSSSMGSGDHWCKYPAGPEGHHLGEHYHACEHGFGAYDQGHGLSGSFTVTPFAPPFYL